MNQRDVDVFFVVAYVALALYPYEDISTTSIPHVMLFSIILKFYYAFKIGIDKSLAEEFSRRDDCDYFIRMV